MKKLALRFVMGLLAAALLMGNMAFAQPTDPQILAAEKAVVLVRFNYEEGQEVALGLVVGEAGQPSRYVFIDNYYYYDSNGYEADLVEVADLQEEHIYPVKGVRFHLGSRMIILETETEIEGCTPMPFAETGEYQTGSELYALELLPTYGFQTFRCVADTCQPMGKWYEDEPLLKLLLDESPQYSTMSVVLGASGGVAAYHYDCLAEKKLHYVFPADQIMDALDIFGIPYTMIGDTPADFWQTEEENAPQNLLNILMPGQQAQNELPEPEETPAPETEDPSADGNILDMLGDALEEAIGSPDP